MPGLPNDSNDRLQYEDVDYIMASGRQYRVAGDTFINGIQEPSSAIPFALTTEFAPLFDGNTGSLVVAQDFAYYIPFDVARYTVFSQIVTNVTVLAAASSMRAGIYSDDGTLRNPGTLLADGGSQAATTTGNKVFPITAALVPGRYWVMAVAQGGTPTVNGTFSSPVRVSFPTISFAAFKGIAGVSGALPSTASAGNAGTGAAPATFLRVA